MATDVVWGGTLEDEVDFNGIKLRTTMRVGYFFDTDRSVQGELVAALKGWPLGPSG